MSSSVSLAPSSKIENSVYLAFGVSIGLALFRWYSPSVFLDIRATVAVALLSGSLIGSFLFYIKLERIITIPLFYWYHYRNRKSMEQFIIRKRVIYTV